jgi:hypothetical protein
LVRNHLTPESFDSLLTIMAQCHREPGVQVAEFDQLMKQVKSFAFLDEPLNRTHGEPPSTITARESLQLYWAYLRAQHRGVDAKVRRRTDAILARHPPGDFKRGEIISRIKDIVDAGQRRERRVGARVGLLEADLIAKAKQVTGKHVSKVLHATPLCQSYAVENKDLIVKELERVNDSRSESRRTTLLNRLGISIGPLVLARCFRADHKKPLPDAKLLALVKRGLKRRHPDSLKDKACLDAIFLMIRRPPRSTPSITDLLTDLISLRERRCLL